MYKLFTVCACMIPSPFSIFGSNRQDRKSRQQVDNYIRALRKNHGTKCLVRSGVEGDASPSTGEVQGVSPEKIH